MKVKDIIAHLEDMAPLSYQESYDNAGLIIGSPEADISSVLITLDVTEQVIEEAIEGGSNLIIAHHPIVFGGLKRFNGNNYVERCVMLAIKNDIAIYASHTNLDSVPQGVNGKICDKLGLINRKVLSPVKDQLLKLVTFIPEEHAITVREAVFNAGAGHIGNYDQCSYNIEGTGTFRGNEDSEPFVGEAGKVHFEKEIRFETILPKRLKGKVLAALLASHPYEEVAYDLYPLENELTSVGIGIVGDLPEEGDEKDFLHKVKSIFNCGSIRHTPLLGRPVKRVAVCGGAGSFLLNKAIGTRADIFITGDFKYHQFFDAEGKIVIADVGHYESEQFTKEVFYESLMKKFPNFAFRLSEVNTNPVNYL